MATVTELKELDPIKRPEKGMQPHLEVSTPFTALNEVITFDPEVTPFRNSNETHPASLDLEAAMKRPEVAVDAQILECDRSGKYMLRSYDKHTLYNRLTHAPVIESAPVRRITFTEALREKYGTYLLREESFDGGVDYPSLGSEPFANFTPLFMGPYYRNQFMYKMLDMKSKCYEAYNNNPVAHRIPSLITQFTLGKGVTVSCKDDKTRQVWDAFARFNKIGTSMNVGLTRAGSRLRMWSNQLSVDGELMLQFVPTKQGLKLNCLDTATILDIVTEPEDIDKVYYYHQQYTTVFQQFIKNNIPGIKYVMRDIPGDQVLHIKINTYENEKRGRSDLASVIGWLKRMKDLINANVIKAYFQACYTWDVMVNGTKEQVQQLANSYKNQIPTPGSSYFHNQNITRTLMPPTGSAGAATDNDMIGLMNMISLGTGIPPAYLIGTMAANRAGVLSETEPSTKFFFERQSVWDEALHSIFDRLSRWHYDQTGEMLDENIEFSFPVINAVDKNTYINALMMMKQNGWFADQRCAEMAAKEWNVTNYTYETEKASMEAEAANAMQRELDNNKMRSAAQSHLSMWQNILSDSAAQEEHDAIGYNVGTGSDPAMQAQMQAQQAQGMQQAEGEAAKGKQQHKNALELQKAKSKEKQNVSGGQKGGASAKKPSGAKSKATSGGITDSERAATKKKVQANAND